MPIRSVSVEERLVQSTLPPGVDADAMALLFNLNRTSAIVLNKMEGKALRRYNLTHAGFWLLTALQLAGPRETRQLATMQRVTKGAVVGCVNTLEAAGLVRRVRSDVDRRLVSVELTPAGSRLIEDVRGKWFEAGAEVTDVLTDREKRTLTGLLRKLASDDSPDQNPQDSRAGPAYSRGSRRPARLVDLVETGEN